MAGFVFSWCEEPRCELHSVETKREAVRLVRSGMSDYQVADVLGVNHSTVSKWARKAGIVRGKGGGCVAKANAERNIEARSRMAEALGGRFDVIGLNPGSRAVLRCRECGETFERKVDTRYPTTCPGCKRAEIERHAEEREFESKRALM